MLPKTFVTKFSVYRVLGPKFDLFQKCQKQNLHFWIFFFLILQKGTPVTLFILFWYPTLHMLNFHFSPFQGVPKIYKYFLWYLIIISTRVCKKIFLIKAKKQKNIFVLGVSKVLSEGENKIKKLKKFHRGISNKKLGKVINFKVGVVKRLNEGKNRMGSCWVNLMQKVR